ncbi:MAG: chondroitin lyase, partial [Bacteroidia bacterium]|nr:chondroitin lyase [Bacteroidia bacterium]
YYLDGICKTAVYGKFPDAGAKNRSISREHALHPFSANTAEQLLLTSDYRKNEIQEIIDIRKNSTKPTLSHATFFWHSEHFSFQRPAFFTSVRMYSTRNYNMEVPYNSEGLLNHYRGDGVNHISVTGNEYYDIWPVYDYQKIPGATITQRPEMLPSSEIQKLGLTDFVGAVTNGLHAAVAFDFKSPHDPLCGRKSWFFFDEEYVCLGAGISSREKLPVVTTLNQSLLKDDVTVSINNKASVISKNEKEYDNVDWVFQDGIGYVFPQPTLVNIKNDVSTGSWWKINRQSDSPKDEINLDVFKIWLNHGEAPSDASYQYIVVPATSVNKLADGASKKNITIVSNTPEIQAVRHSGLDIGQIVFYKSGVVELTAGLVIHSDSPGILMVKMDHGKIAEISVSDPGRELKKFHFTISTRIEKEGKNYKARWNGETRLSEISVDLPIGVYAGQSVTVNLR